MVGVISHLYRKYSGIIALENLDMKTLMKHSVNSNENISRSLEWSLYRKFEKTGLVPPSLRRVSLIRECDTNAINQIGIIKFVPKEDTSKLCPGCGESSKGMSKEDKLRLRKFVCGNDQCGLKIDGVTQTEYPYTPLNGPDDVAAYNIAKRSLKIWWLQMLNNKSLQYIARP
jgi:hypothetical protein